MHRNAVQYNTKKSSEISLREKLEFAHVSNTLVNLIKILPLGL